MQNHRQLDVYQLAIELAVQVYTVVGALPDYERYDLCRQLRRAAVSVGSNIAEGCGRAIRADFSTFLDRALGSAGEIEFQLEICGRIGLAPKSLVAGTLETTRRVQRMLTRLIIRIRQDDKRSRGS